MAKYQLLPGQGLMFPTKATKAKAPAFRGEIRTPTGEVFEVAGWYLTTKNIAKDYLSIKLSKVEGETYNEPAAPEQPDNEYDQ